MGVVFEKNTAIRVGRGTKRIEALGRVVTAAPRNPRRLRSTAGSKLTPVAVVASISAAGATISGTTSTVASATVTAKTMTRDEAGDLLFDAAAAEDVTCYWSFHTAVTIGAGKYRVGWVQGDELLLVDCTDIVKPPSE